MDKNQLSRFKIASLVLIGLFGLTACFNNQEQPSENLDKTPISAKEMSVDENGLSRKIAVMKTIHGNVEIKFYPKEAPNSVTRFLELIQQGFFDGLIFHRVITEHLIQSGDPTGTGKSGSGKLLKAEFNDKKHVAGTVALARKEHIDSADSQFYITLKEMPQLDGKYTVIGKVISGLESLNKINKGDKIISIIIK